MQIIIFSVLFITDYTALGSPAKKLIFGECSALLPSCLLEAIIIEMFYFISAHNKDFFAYDIFYYDGVLTS